jgi:hypothetical protein
VRAAPDVKLIERDLTHRAVGSDGACRVDTFGGVAEGVAWEVAVDLLAFRLVAEAPAEKNASLVFSASLCLSQACLLGKKIVFSVNWRYCELHNNRPKTAETSAIRVSQKIAKTVSRHADVQFSGRFGSNPAVFYHAA